MRRFPNKGRLASNVHFVANVVRIVSNTLTTRRSFRACPEAGPHKRRLKSRIRDGGTPPASLAPSRSRAGISIGAVCCRLHSSPASPDINFCTFAMRASSGIRSPRDPVCGCRWSAVCLVEAVACGNGKGTHFDSDYWRWPCRSAPRLRGSAQQASAWPRPAQNLQADRRLWSSHIGDNGNPAMLKHYRLCLFAGLTTAIMLAQRGWKGITVYDKRAPPPPVESDVRLAPPFSPALRASSGKVQDRHPGN